MKSIPVIYLLFVIFCSFVIVSCNEDKIVTPPNEPYRFDSARYNWKIDTIQGYFAPISVSCVDSNEIYIMDAYRTLIHFDGLTMTPQFLPFSTLGTCVKAYSDKVYIGGEYLTATNFEQPALLIKEDNMFQEVQIPDSNQRYNIKSIERTPDNVLWLGTNKGKLIKYQSGEFQYFQFDSMYYVWVHKDANENIFIVNLMEKYDSIGNNGQKSIEIYKYENNSFTKIYSKYLAPISGYTLSPSIINGEIYARDSYSIFRFIGRDFMNIVDFPGIGPSALFGGSSENDLLIGGIFPFTKELLPNIRNSFLLNWNGTRWSIEFEIYLTGVTDFPIKLGDKYVYVCSVDFSETYLLIGTPKN